jgi:hypothetical protein
MANELTSISFDAVTGESIERPFTKDELAQATKDAAAEKKALAETKAQEAVKASALSKLVKLGLTAEEIAAL